MCLVSWSFGWGIVGWTLWRIWTIGSVNKGWKINTMIPEATLDERLRRCGIRLEDVEESFARSSGPGGQHVNKVETQVRLVHRLSGVSVTVSDSRSREMNRRTAWLRLVEKFEEVREARRLERAAERSRKRVQAARRSPATKRKMVEEKRRRGETKKLRRKV